MGVMSGPTTAESSDEALVGERLRILALAEALGSVSEACRRSGIVRATFYEWRRRLAEHGPQGLRPRPPVAQAHPRQVRAELIEWIRASALAHPGWGCERHADKLRADGHAVSSVAVQKILTRHGLGTRERRWLALERLAAAGQELTAEQEALVAGMNPCWRERARQGSSPGARLVADAVPLGNGRGTGRLNLLAVVDTHNAYAFARLCQGDGRRDATAILRDDVLPFYAGLGIEPGSLGLGDGCELRWAAGAGGDRLPALEPQPRPSNGAPVPVHGFIEQLRRRIVAEVLGPSPPGRLEDLPALRGALVAWLAAYNNDRPQPGFPCDGATPRGRIAAHLERQRRRARRRVWQGALFLLVGLLGGSQVAQEHEWYTGLRTREGESCCNGKDCTPAPICIGANGHEGLKLGGVCFPIPWDKVLDLPSPDGNAHVCWENHPDLFSPIRPIIRCVILPGSA